MPQDNNNEEFPEIPGFRILKTLGRGGMAQVYLGLQESMEREVAIKVMLPQLLTDPSFGDRFLREARIAAKLAHPHIVAVIDVGVAGDYYYMAMEYHPGGDLKDKIRKGLGQKDSMRIMKEIASALDYAHRNGFVHRDIKPDNILFSRSGSAVLSDFGIARAADGGTHLTATGSVVGTPHYMSPEQAQGKSVDGRSDLYSLGIMFYQMLVGKVPFEGDSALSIGIKHIRDPVPRLPEGLAKYQTFLDKLLAKDPEERWQSGADVVRTLEVLDADTGNFGTDTLAATAISGQVEATRVMPSGVTGVTPKKSGTGLVLGALILVGIGGAVAYQQGMIGGAGNVAPPEMAQGAAVSAGVETKDPIFEKIANLLTAAQADYSAGNYFQPADSNATKKYQAVLVLDESNETAKEGLRNISEIFVANARSAISANQFRKAASALELAEQADPGNTQISVVNAQLAASREAARAKSAKASPPPTRTASVTPAPRPDPRLAQLSSYLRQAEDYLSPARLSEKRLESATSAYRSAYRIAPGDHRVTGLPEQIAGGYEVLADELRTQKKWDQARRLVDKGLSLVPDHRGLKTLVAKIDSDKEAVTESTSRRRAFGGF